jgi:transcriptional regulator with XRE-family HTH domain
LSSILIYFFIALHRIDMKEINQVDNTMKNIDIYIDNLLSPEFNLKMQNSTKPTKESRIDSRVLQKIKEALKAKGWKPVKLAREFGYSDAWISNIMKGKRSLDINTLIKIAEILHVEPSSLLPHANPEPKPEFEDYIRSIVREVVKEEIDKALKEK